MQSGLEITRRHPVIELTQWQNEWNHTNFLGAIIGHRHLLCLDGCGLVLQITKSSGKSAFDPKLPGPVKPIHYGSNSIKMEAFDPFNPLSLKLLCLDHANHYVYYPLGSFLDLDVLKISEKLTFITPDMISFSHVMVGALAGKFLSSEMLNQRRIGVLFFEVRSFLDSLDGLVARSR